MTLLRAKYDGAAIDSRQSRRAAIEERQFRFDAHIVLSPVSAYILLNRQYRRRPRDALHAASGYAQSPMRH